ncbi:MAG TPA: DEAD/DEAH box helicase, partial [Gammaproteobacteria bacterium]|nr:DEAD/DEAH box helicase [Gammaproteobacteria bacterium]
MTNGQHLAPGMRVIIRDEEWVVRKAELSSDGGQQLTCDGLSELVKGTEAIFLTQLEGEIQVLDPVDTLLVDDDSSGYSRSLLYIESQLRKRAINDQKIHVAHQGAMDLVPYQLDPALQSLNQPRQRILIADAVGLGKTLEAGILTSELIHRGRGKRILVLTLKSMMTQFQKEFWNRFTIPLTRLDSVGLQRVRSRIPTNHNPFYYYDKSIISIDTLKQDSEYRVYLEQAYWDIIIIDECHNVAERSNSSQRARLAKRLSTRSDTLIMLSATPHDGRAKSFASLMNMLDPTAISDPEHYNKEDFSSKGLVVRRFKKDIQGQVDREFKKRHVFSDRHSANPEEEAAYEALLQISFTRNGDTITGHRGSLLRVTLQKSLFSSPAACSKSVAERIRKLQNREETTEDEQQEIGALQYLDQTLQKITPQRYAKYQALLTRLKN